MAAEHSIPQKIGDRPAKKYLNRYVVNKLVAACAKNAIAWKQVGEELIPGSDSDVDTALNVIEVSSRGDVIVCCSSLFDEWLKRDPHASWELLIKALKIAHLNNLATEIEGMLQPSRSADSTHKTETAKPQIQTDSKSSAAKLPGVDTNSQPPRKSKPLVMPQMDKLKHNPILLGDEKWPFEPPKLVDLPLSVEDVTDVNGLPQYQMKSYPQGIGVIINNKKFYGGMSDRDGTDTDAAALQRLFTHLGFYTGRFNDLTAREIRENLTKISKIDHTMFDCLLVAILTHGDDGNLYGTDSKPIAMKNLTELFHGKSCPSLVGKPKIFIVQACRGKEKDSGVKYDPTDGDDDKEANKEQSNFIPDNIFKKEELDEADSTGSLPNKADFLIAYSTIPGHVSWRNRENGSYFITALINVFTEMADMEHLLDMLTEVNRRIAEEVEAKDITGKKKQTPEPVFTLRKRLYFNPGKYTAAK